jgi:acyl dehydratase
MGPGLVLRVLSKRPRPAPAGAPGPLISTFTLPGLDHGHVARYGAALGFEPGRAPGPVPLSYWYLPVQRAHMATLLSDAFPYRLAGIVHVENALTAHAPVPPGAPVELATRIDILPPSSSGAVYCALETVGSSQGERIFTCTSKYLAVRGQGSGKGKRAAPPAQPGAVIDSWTLAPSSGRAYARISGDWNPIHLTRWSARLMGLPAPIIHGMHSLAKTCAALEKAAGRRVAGISVRFTAPIALGSTAVLTAGSAPGRYALFCGAVLAAEGAYTLA